MDDSKEKRIEKLIEEISNYCDPLISEAVEKCKTVDDVINYIIHYRGHNIRFNEYESSDIREAFKWLELNIHWVDTEMRLRNFSSCMSIIELINRAYYSLAPGCFHIKENEIQELINLVHGSDTEKDNDVQEKEI